MKTCKKLLAAVSIIIGYTIAVLAIPFWAISAVFAFLFDSLIDNRLIDEVRSFDR